ncbi:type II secretion system protein GspM [Pseudomonas sp. JDS28PS106]|uniref:type II secretion system protein GspM n=1 Tax=Pseudomonas sp. JDS28PS106 TaxID=2497235 RepID=UPI002FD191AD
MQRPLTPRERRIGAWLLLAALFALFYALILQPLYIGPWIRTEQQIRAVAEQREHYRALLARDDRTVRDTPDDPTQAALSSLLLQGDDPSAVAADLMQTVTQQVTEHAQRGAGCRLTQRMPIVAQDTTGPLGEVRLSLDLECATEPLLRLLHRLESGEPWLFVDELVIRRAGNASGEAGPGRLSVHLLVSGFLAVAPADGAPEIAR